MQRTPIKQHALTANTSCTQRTPCSVKTRRQVKPLQMMSVADPVLLTSVTSAAWVAVPIFRSLWPGAEINGLSSIGRANEVENRVLVPVASESTLGSRLVLVPGVDENGDFGRVSSRAGEQLAARASGVCAPRHVTSVPLCP